MDRSIIWSELALSDIQDIAEYIDRDSPFYARQVVQRILESGEALQQNPERGRVVPGLSSPFVREIFVYSYTLIYQVSDIEVEILAVIHGKRLL